MTVQNIIGCQEGYPVLAYEHILDKGIQLETRLAYSAVKENCDNSVERIKISSYSCLDDNVCAIKRHLKNAAPDSALICAADKFQQYKGGVFSEVKFQDFCGRYLVNHAVLVVGYGTVVSWGTTWGYEVLIKI